LWSETIEAHRLEVRDAIMSTTAALVAEHGLRAVTMSQIAEQAGIGRATLYKYFPDVEAILVAEHDRHVEAHLEQLEALADQSGDAFDRLADVLEAYAMIRHHQGRHGTELSPLLHRPDHIAWAHRRLLDLFRQFLVDAVEDGDLRDDAAPIELAQYCISALGAAGGMPSKAAVRRLVTVTIAGLRPSM
jgi:AcrR family transcriptional regulator